MSPRAVAPKAVAPPKKTGGPAKDSKSSVQSLAKGFRILEAFSADDEPLTITEVAERAGLDPGTAFRMLNTLVDLGYVSRSDKRRYALTLKILDLGFNAIGRSDLRGLVRPALRSLVGETSEAASFGILQGSDVVYVERMRAGLTRLGVDIRIGTAIPASVSVLGRAILAFLPPAGLERALAHPTSAGAEAYPATIRARLSPELDAIRQQGYALSASMITAGLVALAVPVRDADGFAIGAISVAAASIVCSAHDLREKALQHLQTAAADVSKAMQTSGSAIGA
ncbi:MAG: IclR family transcriptional regulator [Beijerinckiaceae bacterium]|nr:IclR family transcriptional regulator [Beijerinckiaceae bacterium]MDO9442115.1 IclR family transcriptional regulator [Beijerinckiaceae bacterium]